MTRISGQQPDEAPSIEVDASPAARRGRRILVTNDDGIESEGLRRLASVLATDHDVIVAAPAEDVSGAGTGIGRLDAAEAPRLLRRDFEGVEAYSIEGPPGLAVMAAALGAFGDRPDLVVSGVNAGMNTGTSIIHSGTVGAALTARTFGICGLAVSLAWGSSRHLATAVGVARSAADWVLDTAGTTTLNVNVPGLAPSEVRGSRWASIDDFGHFRVASADPVGRVLDLEVHERRSGSDPRSDTALCLAGFVTLTLLSPLGGAQPPQGEPDILVQQARPRR